MFLLLKVSLGLRGVRGKLLADVQLVIAFAQEIHYPLAFAEIKRKLDALLLRVPACFLLEYFTEDFLRAPRNIFARESVLAIAEDVILHACPSLAGHNFRA